MAARLRGVLLVIVLIAGGVLLGSALSQRLGGPPGRATQSRPSRVRVEVLNAGGVAGAARSATDRLRDRGFDVVYFGNAPRFGADSSVVLDRSGHLDDARAVADALGIRNVRSEVDANLYLDVSVWLGREWSVPEEGDAGAGRPWWDPRRWLRR